MNWLRETPEGTVLQVLAVPRASTTKIEGLHGDSLRIRLNAPPADGQANKALKACLANALGIPGNRLQIRTGAGSRRKSILVQGMLPKTVSEKLGIPGPS